jgi:Na+-driven multidrug efflux pump
VWCAALRAAFGAKKMHLVGIWFVVSLVVVGGLGVIVFVSWHLTGVVLRVGGYHGKVLHYATLYSQVLSIGLPAMILRQQLTSYFQGQGILQPAVIVSVIAMVLNLLLQLFVTLGLGFKGWDGVGFVGCPMCVCSVCA